MPRFDDQLLASYMDGFYGYGNFGADYWFIGMEEGGGDAFDEVKNRLDVWDSNGRRELEDLKQYHSQIGVDRWFSDDAKLQPTWNKIIRVMLSAQGVQPETQLVREFQATKLGGLSGDACLIELMPLPSPSTGDWLYAQCSGLDELGTRDAYLSNRGPLRVARIRSLIAEHQPKHVIFYGMSYLESWWRQVADVELAQRMIEGRLLYMGQGKSTVYAATQHPVATGVSNEYFHGVGQLLGSMR